MNPILYVLLNGELKMSSGKAAAQAVHAAKMLGASKDFANYKRTVIILEAKNSEQLRNLHEYLKTAGIKSCYYIDEGANEVDAYSLTALAVYPFDYEDEAKREIFASFPLYGDGSSENVNDDYDDDCGGNYCESEQDAVNRTIYDISRQVGNLSLKVAQLAAPKPKWYDRFRKKRGFVS
jgi:peptidyl-tRNA hydrolase